MATPPPATATSKMATAANEPRPVPNDTTPSTSLSTSPSQAVPQPPPVSLTNDPAVTGYDPSRHWFVNYVRIRLGQVTADGAQHYREDRYRANEARDCARCEQWRDWAFAHSPVVRFLREKVAALNGELDATNVACRRCPARRDAAGGWHRMAAGFDPRFGIQLCANELSSRAHLEEVLAHEMVHAWDHLRFKMDWVGDTDLRHAACTEIRAAMLSGECRWTKETFTRGNLQLTQQFQNCVRMRAVMSVMARPRCKDDVQAVKVVNEVWDSCFSDKRPFDEVFR